MKYEACKFYPPRLFLLDMLEIMGGSYKEKSVMLVSLVATRKEDVLEVERRNLSCCKSGKVTE